jgi:hypothetical protein
MWGTAEVNVKDGDIQDLTIVMQPAMSASGRLVRTAASANVPLRVVFLSRSVWFGRQPVATVGLADGTFSVGDLGPGRYEITCVSERSGPLALSVMLDGQPIPGNVIEISAGQNVTGLVLTLGGRQAGAR